MKYRPQETEPKWQARWEAEKTFRCDDVPTKPKFYCLEMFPYPSGRIHMGHVRVYTLGDVIARYKRMNGFQVLHPIGWDAFGLPAENAAHRHGTHPAVWTRENIAFMRTQLHQLGFSYDWDRELATCDPDYYKWEQLVFLKMMEDGTAYRKRATLNWCEECQTVLANEQVNRDGTCFIHDQNPVSQKELDQWFIGITKYAEELLSGHDELRAGWPENIIEMQKNWIGRSEGAEIGFPIDSADGGEIRVFTTRPDTLYGVTFMSVAPEHPLVMSFAKASGREAEVAAFVEKVAKQDRIARTAEDAEKEGVFTGAYCRNPLTGEKVPVYAANFVLFDYGTGAVMAVPGHDQRDFDFAKKYDLPIKVVISPDGVDLDAATMACAHEGEGTMVSSREFDGMRNDDGKRAVTRLLEDKGFGKGTIQYRLRDWGVSRQRYWGCPIPVIHCDSCGIVPVPEKDLPVVLPEDLPYTREKGNPLNHAEGWLNVPCPICGKPAKRETNTFDTFMESSWYFHRYIDSRNGDAPLDPSKMATWMPVDQYVGGVEHACMHLIYARFFHKYLRDKGFVPGNEPFTRLLSQGMVCMSTVECAKHGWRYPEEVVDGKCVQCGEAVSVGRSVKMSKSKRNVVEPSVLVEKFGADTVRLFSLFAAPPEKDLDWSEQGVEGGYRFLSRIHRLVAPRLEALKGVSEGPGEGEAAKKIRRVTHRTIQRVSRDMDEARYQFNTAISAVMEMVNALYLVEEEAWADPATAPALKEAVSRLLLLMSPFAPHLSEELWERLGGEGFAGDAAWPTFDAELAKDEEVVVVIQVNGKVRAKIVVSPDATEEEVVALVNGDPKVGEWTGGKPVKKMVYVPKKLLSIVVG